MIHDYEGFAGLHLGEYEDVTTVTRLDCGIVAHGEAFGAFAAWCGRQADEETFLERYRGTWPAERDYAKQLLDDLGVQEVLQQLPYWLSPYLRLDVDGFARDPVCATLANNRWVCFG